jgi:hypothetical protein
MREREKENCWLKPNFEAIANFLKIKAQQAQELCEAAIGSPKWEFATKGW